MEQFVDTLLNGPARYTQEHHFDSLWALVFVLGIFFAECIAVYLLFLLLVKLVQSIPSAFAFILRACGVAKEETAYAFLELTFPADTSKSAFATEQLHILLRGQNSYNHIWDKWAGRKKLR